MRPCNPYRRPSGSARSCACARFSVVRTPKPIGIPVASMTSMMPARTLAGDKSKCERLSANDAPNRDERVEAPALDNVSARQRKLEASGDVEKLTSLVLDVAVAQRALRTIYEHLGKLGVEARRHDREAPLPAIGRRRRVAPSRFMKRRLRPRYGRVSIVWSQCSACSAASASSVAARGRRS